MQERGVCLPLTTPMLIAARVRLLDRDGLELVVPKASGGRGNYVVPWRNVTDLCQPGVHDTRLLQRIGTLGVITPATVREAGLLTEAEGFAGRRVRAAARATMEADQKARAATHYHVLLGLIRQIDGAPSARAPIPPAQFAPLARRAMGLLASRLGRESDRVAEGVATMTAVLSPLGLGDRVATARIPALLVRMQALRQSLASLPTETPWEAAAVHLITRTAEVTLSGLTSTVAEARGRAEHIPDLLTAWLADPAGITTWMTRSEWLADGWNWLCNLWSLADDASAQRRLLDEMVLILPTLPKEVAAWVGFSNGGPLPVRITPRAAPVYRESLNIVDAIMRNETLLALSA